MPKLWSAKELELLEKYYPENKIELLKEKTKRTEDAIRKALDLYIKNENKGRSGK